MFLSTTKIADDKGAKVSSLLLRYREAPGIVEYISLNLSLNTTVFKNMFWPYSPTKSLLECNGNTRIVGRLLLQWAAQFWCG